MNTFVGSVRLRETAKSFARKADGKPMASLKCYMSHPGGKGEDGKMQYRYTNIKVLVSGAWLVRLAEGLAPKTDIMVSGAVAGVEAWMSEKSGEPAGEITVMANEIFVLAPREYSNEGGEERKPQAQAQNKNHGSKAQAPRAEAAKPTTESDEDFPF